MGNVNMEASQINYRNNSKPSAHTVGDALDRLFTSDDAEKQDIIDLTAAMTAKADKIDIAPTFSAENTYFSGDLVFQSGRLWKFTTDHTPGEWDQEEVTATNIDLAIKAGGASLPDYSTTEQATGQKWIDGKDIYFKVYTANLTNNTNVLLEEDFGLTKEIVYLQAVISTSNGQYQYPCMGYCPPALSEYAFPGVVNNNLVVAIKDDFSSYAIKAVIYYTKTV